MDQLTHAVRRENWSNIIKQCQSRPENISAKQWLAENGIRQKSYYYWLRKFRAEAYEQMQLPATTSSSGIAFAELPMPLEKNPADTFPVMQDNAGQPSAVIKTNRFAIELSDHISPELLSMILKEVSNA